MWFSVDGSLRFLLLSAIFTHKGLAGLPNEYGDYNYEDFPNGDGDYPNGNGDFPNGNPDYPSTTSTETTTVANVTREYNSETYNTVIKRVLSNTDVEIVPKTNLSEPLDFNITFDLLSLASFDEISGEISLVASLKLSWSAETTPTWNPESMLGGKKSVTVSAADIWKPQLFVLNPSQKVRDLASDLDRLRISYDGSVEWDVVTVIEAACTLDVTYFPFDAQTCSIYIAPWGYDNTELLITGFTSTSDYLSQDHGGWGFLSLEANGNNEQETPYLNVTVQFKRRYEFFLINILLPPSLLSAMNPCVFLLPAASGERMSFSITCFLAFSVFMTLLGDNMPKSSVPISHLSYFLMFMLVHSCCIALATIITLRVYNKDGVTPVPKWLQVLIKLVRFRYCKNYLLRHTTPVDTFTSEETVNVHTEEFDVKNNDEFDIKKSDAFDVKISDKIEPNDGDDVSNKDEISWFLVGRTLDYFFFCLFLGWILFSLITTLMAISFI